MNKIIISDDRGYRCPTHFAKIRMELTGTIVDIWCIMIFHTLTFTVAIE